MIEEIEENAFFFRRSNMRRLMLNTISDIAGGSLFNLDFVAMTSAGL
jgi:hypothetical protein